MRKLEVALGIALTTSVAVAFSLWTQLRNERAVTADLRSRMSAAAPRSAPLTSRPTDAAVPVRVVVGPAAPATVEAASTANPPPRVAGRKEDWQEYQRKLLQDPRYVEAVREQRRLTYRLRRDNAMRLFGFSAETADAIVDLDVDQELQMMSAEPNESPAATQARFETAQRDHDDKMLALLGRDRFDTWQTYMETRGTRMQVDRFRAQLNGADMLRDDQVEPLITALAAAQKQTRDELESYREPLGSGQDAESWRQIRARQLELATAANKRMLASAASILSPSQVKHLEDMLANELAQRASQERIESLRQKIGPGPADGPGSD